MNMGSAEFNGLENPDAEVEMDIFGEANDGSGTWARKPAGRTSVRQLLTKMKGKEEGGSGSAYPEAGTERGKVHLSGKTKRPSTRPGR